MSRSVALALIGAAVAVGALQACDEVSGREDVAIQGLQTRLCDKARECGCPPLVDDELGQPLQCGEWPVQGFEFSFNRSLAFDPSCLDRWVQWVDAIACNEPARPSYTEVCPLYHGTLREGDPCYDEEYSPFETLCGRNLLCIAGTCRDTSNTAFGTEGQPCDVDGRCDRGLACTGSLCERLPGPGELCLDGYRCNRDSFCPDRVCEALPGPGEPCSSTCQTGAFCSVDPVTFASECRYTGGVGEPCSGHRQCTSGNCPAGACEEPAGAGDPCDFQLPCGSGFSCVAGVCRAGACTLLGSI